jgi:hypothetical protein
MKSCPKCSRENPDDVAFCVFCGNKFSLICRNCGRENIFDAVVCGYCGISLVAGTTPDNSPPAKPDLPQPAPVSLEAPIPNTIKPARSVWLVGAIWAVLITAIVTISKIAFITDPNYLSTQLIIGTPAAFLLWWLVFTLLTFLWRKTKTNKLVHVIIVLLVFVILFVVLFLGGGFLKRNSLFAIITTPSSASTRTPWPFQPQPCDSSFYGDSGPCLPIVEIAHDQCFMEKGLIVMEGSVTNNDPTTKINEIEIVLLICGSGEHCRPKPKSIGDPNSKSSIPTAVAQSDRETFYNLVPKEMEYFRLTSAAPPNPSAFDCQVNYYIYNN